jgi:2-phospho-L-lactate guanylyltransferase
MKTLVILPVKSFDDAKQRLRAELQPAPRRSLVEAMFSDVLVALRRAALVEQVLVVSNHNGAQRIAGGYGAMVVDDLELGHNEAAVIGVERALELGAERALLVPGDCPLLAQDELDELIGRPVGNPSALIVPDRHGTGTNALLLTPPDVLAPSFGPGSRERHEAAARAAGIEVQTVPVPSLALDVDTPEDLAAVRAALESSHGGAAHTRGMLRQLSRSWE